MENLQENLEAAAAKAVDAKMETNNFATKADLDSIPKIETNNFATKEDVQLVAQQVEKMEVNSNRSTEPNKITSISEVIDMEVNSLQNSENSRVKFELNAASTYTPSAGADSAPGREDRQVEIEYDPFQFSIAAELMQRTGGGQAYRLSTKTAGTSNADGKTQGSAFGRTTKSVSDQYIPYVTVGHVLTVPKEDLEDTNALQAYFEEEMQDEIIEAVNAQVLTGDGTAGNLQGIETWSAPKTAATFETFYGTGLADQYGTTANQIDVLVAAKAALKADNFDERTGQFCAFVNPDFIANIQGDKGTDGHYIVEKAVNNATGMGMQPFLAGIKIIETAAVASGEFYLFHSSALKFVTRQGMGAEVGYDGDDWSRNNLSLKAYGRYALVSGKPNGIVNGTFANAITALNA